MYVKEDYTFYEQDFKRNTISNLRTDGVYILENIWTKDASRKPEEYIFYKFYEEGQANITIDLDHQIKTEQDYIESIKTHISLTNQSEFKTLFEGYYKIEENKIVIQRLSSPRNLFVYNYGFVEKDKLIIVKETIDGKGKIEDKYFTDYYKETYRFLPLDKSQIENLKPGW